MQVSQGGVAGVPPEVLVRFHAIVGEGNITGPYRDYLFYWKTTRKDAIDAIFGDLWPYLSAEKRQQFEKMTLAAGRSLPALPQPVRSQPSEIAWAAGLFDGEGSMYISGRDSTTLEVPQSSAVGVPEVLVRFRAAVARGRINGPYPPRSPWSRLPQFRWTARSRAEISDVLNLLWPHLSLIKREQALAVSASVGRAFVPDPYSNPSLPAENRTG